MGYLIYTINYNATVKYVGKTNNIRRRKIKHLHRVGTYESAIPVDADLDSIEFNIIDMCDDRDEALIKEGMYIDLYDTIANGWNKQRSGLVTKKKKKKGDRVGRPKMPGSYYSRNREMVLSKCKDYYKEKREERMAYQIEYYKNHKAEIKERYKKHKKVYDY